MDYTQWQQRDFANVGVRMALPASVKAEEVFDGKNWILSMGFHKASPPPGVLDDATVFVHIYVNRITLEQFTERKASYVRGGLYKQETDEEHKVWFWYYDLHPETSRWDSGGIYSYYRRDLKLNNREILHTHVEVLNAGPQESRDADHAAVKRILDSIQPLIVTTNK